MFQLHYGHLHANYLYKNINTFKLYTIIKFQYVQIFIITVGRPADNCNSVETCYQEIMWQININIKNGVLKL